MTCWPQRPAVRSHSEAAAVEAFRMAFRSLFWELIESILPFFKAHSWIYVWMLLRLPSLGASRALSKSVIKP